MTIFITGATGFIGQALAIHLANDGHIVHALYRSEIKARGLQHPNVKLYKGDISDIASIENAMAGCVQVYHIAALAAVSEPNKGDFIRYNVKGTLNVLDIARKLGIQRVVVTSTAGILGPSLRKAVDETSVSEIAHFTGYEQSKAQMEEIIRQRVSDRENIVIVNPTRVFGPGVINDSNTVTKMICGYVTGTWHIVPGNGKSIGNYAYIKDILMGHILAMEKGRAGQRYILGGENLSYDEFFQQISSVSSKKTWLVHIPLTIMLLIAFCAQFFAKIFRFQVPVTAAHVHKFNYDWNVTLEKAVHDLGYNVTPFKQAVGETLQWMNSLKRKHLPQ